MFRLKKYLFLIAPCILVMLSCNQPVVDKTKSKIHYTIKDSNKVAVTKQHSIPFDTTAGNQLLRYSCTHQFSDSSSRDIFSITLYGKSIDSGNIVFKITDHTHRQIYRETFPASDMLGDLMDVVDKKGSEDTIKRRMAAFLDTSNFHSPAIGSNENVEDAFENADKSDISNWKDIKSDTTSIAFIYSHGYEGTYGIAYSKKQKRVVAIFYSD
ncbi:MAG: hypothetical protein ACTHNW_08885 [Mucilaginibacter sp.]